MQNTMLINSGAWVTTSYRLARHALALLDPQVLAPCRSGFGHGF
jgi:hypothetical protein